MTALQIIEKSQEFVNELREKLTDETEQHSSKQAYFMDNYETVQKYMTALKKVIVSMQENTDDGNEQEEMALLNQAQDVVNQFKQTITDFQKTLTISEDVQEEQTSVALNEETIKEAMQSNKATQEIMQNMDTLAQSKKMPYNYAMLCDGEIHLIEAPTKDALINSINSVANEKTYSDITLYQLTFTPVPLKKQTFLTV